MDGFKFKKLSKKSDINHLICYRSDGYSEYNYSSLNLSFLCGDNEKSVLKNRWQIAGYFDVPIEKLLIPEQCHTNNIVIIKDSARSYDLSNTDGLITNAEEICIGVLSADCVPILLYDKVQRVIGALHAGWRGTVSGIQEKAIGIMQEEFNSNPENILVGIGPSISQPNYEVGMEVVKEFRKIFSDTQFIKLNKEKGNIDLAKANKAKLSGLGIPESNIEICTLCTFDNPDKFFSARRDGFHTGRFGAFIKLKKAHLSEL